MGFIPVKLPIGMTAFDTFAEDILKRYNLPDKNDYRNAIATMILHMGPQKNFQSPRYFAKAILKSMANQIAYEKIQQFKEAQKLEVVGGSESEGAPAEVVLSS